MKKNHTKRNAILISAVLCAALLSGCSSKPASSGSAPGASQESQQQAQDQTQDQASQSSGADMPGANPNATSVGEFTTQDVSGETYTEEIFQDYDLTMVNVFTTWCSPCVAEMPDLEELHQMMADQNVNVVGVVLDVLDEKGEIVPEYLEQAQLLIKETGVTYPVLLPDSTYLNGRLIGIEGFPETFFVDKDGNIVGEVYSGSRDLEDWKEIVEQELANLKGGA